MGYRAPLQNFLGSLRDRWGDEYMDRFEPEFWAAYDRPDEFTFRIPRTGEVLRVRTVSSHTVYLRPDPPWLEPITWPFPAKPLRPYDQGEDQ